MDGHRFFLCGRRGHALDADDAAAFIAAGAKHGAFEHAMCGVERNELTAYGVDADALGDAAVEDDLQAGLLRELPERDLRAASGEVEGALRRLGGAGAERENGQCSAPENAPPVFPQIGSWRRSGHGKEDARPARMTYNYFSGPRDLLRRTARSQAEASARGAA